MENKNIYEKISLRGDSYDLSEFAPENDYILILGTSHSCGVCVRGDRHFLDSQEEVWCYQVAERLGLDVFNISVGGQTSLNMLAQFNDYFEYFDKSKCKMVFAEVRLHEGSEVFSNDLIKDFNYTDRAYSKITPAIAMGRDIGAHSSLIDSVLLNRFVFNHKKSNSAENIAKAVDINAGPTSIKMLKQVIDTYTQVSSLTSRDYIRDLVYIQSLISLSKAHGIPFYWFGWDNSFVDATNKIWIDAGFEKVTNIFENRFKFIPTGLVEIFERTYGFDKMMEIKCECGHFGTEMHDLAAQLILQELKNLER